MYTVRKYTGADREKVDGGGVSMCGMRSGRSVYLKKGGLRPVLFIHAAGFANGHNYTLHVRGHHRLPGEAGTMSNKTTGPGDETKQGHALCYVLRGNYEGACRSRGMPGITQQVHALVRAALL